MRVVIIEDEFYAAEKLKKELLSLQPEIKIVALLDSCEACLSFFENNSEYDLIFSDIHLADGICFNVLPDLDIQSPIIFTTAYDKYALQAFESNGIDYLLKPIQSERLSKAISKYKSLSSSGHDQDIYSELKSLLVSTKKEYKTRFLCKLGTKIKSIPVSSICYFYSKDKLTFIVDQNKNRYPVNHTLDEIDQMMDPHEFFRLNRQFIAHFKAIHEIHPYFKGRLKIKLHPEIEDDIVISTERSPLMRSWLDR